MFCYGHVCGADGANNDAEHVDIQWQFVVMMMMPLRLLLPMLMMMTRFRLSTAAALFSSSAAVVNAEYGSSMRRILYLSHTAKLP